MTANGNISMVLRRSNLYLKSGPKVLKIFNPVAINLFMTSCVSVVHNVVYSLLYRNNYICEFTELVDDECKYLRIGRHFARISRRRLFVMNCFQCDAVALGFARCVPKGESSREA